MQYTIHNIQSKHTNIFIFIFNIIIQLPLNRRQTQQSSIL
jgi:hypothetical protein